MEALENEIANWDGKSTQAINDIYQRYSDTGGFDVSLVEYLAQQHLQKGASWLLKKRLESGTKLNTQQQQSLYRHLKQLQNWESKLHILQCLPYIDISSQQKKAVETFVRDCLTDTNKFVRAWAYNGFYHLAKHHDEYREECLSFLEMAMRDEAASIKARIRNILKESF